MKRGFPYTAPKWPTGVPRPPAKSRTGMNYETAWARRYGVRLARSLVLDGIVRPAVQALASPTVTGLDRLEGLNGPVIFAANHASHIDTPLLLVSLPLRFRHRTVVAAGADYFFDKAWKSALSASALAAVPIERTKVSRRSADLTAALLDDGWNLVIYPEGGRTPDGWGQTFRAGAAYLSVRCGAPVVPVHLEGTRRIVRRGSRRITPSTTHVTFGRPLVADEGEDARDMAVRIEAAVAELADAHATDWWSARRRAAAGDSPALGGPELGGWRRAWALPEGRRRVEPRRWPD